RRKDVSGARLGKGSSALRSGGWNKTVIADKLGMSRNTVTRLLELSGLPRDERSLQGSKLDPHKGSVAKMLKEDAPAPATVIIEYLRRDGYDGGITILKEFLAEVCL